MLKRWPDIVTVSCLVVCAVVEAGQQALRDAPEVSALIPSFIRGGWWNYIPLAFLIGAGVSWIVGRISKPGPTQSSVSWRNPHFDIVSGHTYVNKSIEIDGKSFRDCSFENVSFIFHGLAPAEFLGNTKMSRGFSLDTDNPAIMLYAKLQRMARAFPGAQIKEGTIDDRGNLLVDNFGIKPLSDVTALAEQTGNTPALEQSMTLSNLPVYAQDLHVKLLSLQEGTTLDLEKAALFLKLSVVCDEDTSLREMMIWFEFGEGNYSEAPLENLSGWLIRIPFHNPDYPYKSFQEQSLENVSLWHEIQHNGLKAGLVKIGWVGVNIPNANFRDKVVKVRVDVKRTQPRKSYRFHFAQWAESEDKIFDIDFRRP